MGDISVLHKMQHRIASGGCAHTTINLPPLLGNALIDGVKSLNANIIVGYTVGNLGQSGCRSYVRMYHEAVKLCMAIPISQVCI